MKRLEETTRVLGLDGFETRLRNPDGPEAVAAIAALRADDGYVRVPREPTEAMVKASNRALREIISSVPEPERKRRWGEPTERGYQISGDEKAAIRYRAMIVASPGKPDAAL